MEDFDACVVFHFTRKKIGDLCYQPSSCSLNAAQHWFKEMLINAIGNKSDM